MKKSGNRNILGLILGSNGVRTIWAIGLVLLLMASAAAAVPGSLIKKVTVPVHSSSCCGIGVDYDGTNILYTNYPTPIVYKTNMNGDNLGSIKLVNPDGTPFSDGLNAIAYNFKDGNLYGGGWSSTNLYKTNMSTGVTTLVKANAIPPAINFIDGLAWDPTDNTFWMSDDAQPYVGHLDINGNTIGSFIGTAVTGYPNSGLAVGLDGTLWYGTNGYGRIYALNTNTNPPTNLGVFSSPGGRDEDMVCGPKYTYPSGEVVDTLLSKDAYDNTFSVIEVKAGLCTSPAEEKPKGSISGVKYNDLNGNGVMDAGEPGLEDVKIILKGDSGVLSTATAADGTYAFKDLSDGVYAVGEAVPDGWQQTAPATGSYEVLIRGSNAVTGQDFGNFKLGEIHGMKFEDLNADGEHQHDAEAGLSGWTITLTKPDGTTETTVTNASGHYMFSGLTVGTYTVAEVQQDGWTQTAPADGSYTIEISSGTVIEHQHFGNFHRGKITGGGWINITGDPKATFGLVGQYPDSSNTAQGNVEFQDHASKLNIKSTQINSVATTLDKKKGVITGVAQVNGAGAYSFVVYVEDNGEPGKGKDIFRLSLPDYPYANGAILTNGNIQIHN